MKGEKSKRIIRKEKVQNLNNVTETRDARVTLYKLCLRFDHARMKLITLIQENNLDGRSERYTTHVYAFAHLVRGTAGAVTDRTASASRHCVIILVASIIGIIIFVVVGAHHIRRHIATLGQ